MSRWLKTLLVVGLTLWLPQVQAEPLKLTSGVGAPYFLSDNKGFLQQLIPEVFRRVGIAAEAVQYDASARANINANNGIDDGVAMRVKGLEQNFPNLVRIEEKIIDNEFVAYSQAANFATRDFEALRPYQVAYITGWKVFDDAILPGTAVTRVQNAEQLFALLANGRADIALFERWQGNYLLRTNRMPARALEPPLIKTEMFMYLHKKHAHLAAPAAKALRAMKADGSYQRIFASTLAPQERCDIVIGSCHRAPLSAEGSGIVDKLVNEAFRRIGKQSCIVALPCERSLMNANSGMTDGDILRIPAAIENRYPHLQVVSELLYPLPMSIFTLRKDIQPQKLEDLAPLRVGHIVGWKILEDRVKADQVVRVRGPEELFALLTDNRVDVVIYERLTGTKAAAEAGLKNIRVIDPPLILLPQHLVLHERHAELREPLAAALRAMKADGTYDRAFRSAGVSPPASQ